MLVLSCRLGEGIVIGDVIAVQVSSVTEEEICLTIDAPFDLPRWFSPSGSSLFAVEVDRFAGGYEIPADQETVTLQVDQSIRFGSTVVITPIRIRDDKVRLEINAPREIWIHRKEIGRLERAVRRHGPQYDQNKID